MPELTPEVVISWARLQQMSCCHAAGLTGAEFWLTTSDLGKEAMVPAMVACVLPEGIGSPALFLTSSDGRSRICCRITWMLLRSLVVLPRLDGGLGFFEGWVACPPAL